MSKVDYRQGDYRAVADRLRPAAEQLVSWCSLGAGDLVVDVAAGSGNVARLCAARGASVLAVDLVPEQLLLGRQAGGDGIRWVAGDAQALPVRDGVAAAALSTFGLIYADRPDDAVRELARVCAPGGHVGMTAWPDGEYQAGSAAVLRELAGIGGDGHDHIAAWGDADRLAARLRAVADDVEVRTGQLEARFASVDDWWQTRSLTTPPIVTARQRLDDEAFAELGRRLREVAARSGVEQDGQFVLRDTYLVALGRRR